MGKNDSLARVRIASPCTADWDEMQGDDKVRFYNLCSLNVYNAIAMTDAEVLEKVNELASGKKVCMRLFKRVDGTVLTEDCPVGWRKARAQLRKAACCAWGSLSLAISFVVTAVGTAEASQGQSTGATASATASATKRTNKSKSGRSVSGKKLLWKGRVRGSGIGVLKEDVAAKKLDPVPPQGSDATVIYGVGGLQSVYVKPHWISELLLESQRKLMWWHKW